MVTTTEGVELPQTKKSTEGEQSDIPYMWMLKPCWVYKDEYKDCKRIRERFNQYFIFGEFKDCSQWKTDYNNCTLHENTQDMDALTKVLESEKERVKVRMSNHYKNDIWENREKPPEDWNKELPPEISAGYDTSFLYARSVLDKEKQDDETKSSYFSSCVIM